MNVLSDIYYKSLAKNEENLRFWENYLQNLRALDFAAYADKLKVPALIPVGSKVFFRGVLKHTNEVTVALGADYFVKCSLSQAEVLRQHRIKDAESKVEALQKERDYIQNQLQFGAENVFQGQGQEIVEEFTEEEDAKWREKHRENMRQYKQRSKTEKTKEEVDDEELWSRLEELELQEELEEEMAKVDNVPEGQSINKLKREHEDNLPLSDKTKYNLLSNDNEDVPTQYVSETRNKPLTRHLDDKKSKDNFNLELLQQVIDRQNELKDKLTNLKNKEGAASKTEKDLLSRLDEMDQLDELEDEMDRLDDILQNEDVEDAEDEEEEESEEVPAGKIKRSVSFADEDDSETLELEFTHSETEPDTKPYDKEKGMMKPSDIYEAFSSYFTETTSILKKSKYERDLSPCRPRVEKRIKVANFQEAEDNRQMNKTIVVNDVVEKVDENDNKFESGEKRPMSLFKKRRQQNPK